MLGLIAGAVVLVGLLVVAVPVWLGVCVLRGRTWARYALIAVSLLMWLGVRSWPLVQNFELLEPTLILIPVLLVWAELRERGKTGSFRGSWRGVIQIPVNYPALKDRASTARRKR